MNKYFKKGSGKNGARDTLVDTLRNPEKGMRGGDEGMAKFGDRLAAAQKKAKMMKAKKRK